jgi:hypothetical protein
MRLLLALVVAALPCVCQDFYPFSVDQDRLSGAADFSSLNHPITAADRVFVRDGHFFTVGKDLKPNTRDDQRVRFFGVNLAFAANFPEPADAPRIAKRLRRLGVNIVRLHHMDTSPDSRPENANSILTTGPYPTLNPVSVARLRGFLDALKAEGIYADLNLHVGYAFRPEVDKVPPMPAGTQWPTQGKPIHIFYPRMVDLQLKFTADVIAALKLGNDPVLAVVEINNETSLLEAWGRGALDRALKGEYREEWLRQWRAFSKSDADIPAPVTDRYLEFLAERDRDYLRRMLATVRTCAGSLVPVTGTQMGYGGPHNLDSHADMTYQDNHYYIDHYNFPNQRWDARDWRMRDTSAVGTGMSSFLNMAAARELGKPYTLSEYNQNWPNRQAAECDTAISIFGAVQDWDGLMHFAYSHNRNWDDPVPSGFDLKSDWGKWPTFGQAAWLFRTGAVAAAKSLLEIPVTPGMQLKFGHQKRVGAVSAFFEATAGYDPAAAFTRRVGMRKGSAEPAPMQKLTTPYRSDTGEVEYDREARTYIVKAPQASGAFGYYRKVEAGAADFELVPNGHDFAAILITSIDRKPLGESRRMLISTPGYTLSTLPKSDPPRPQRIVAYPGAKDWWTLEPEAGSGKPSGNRGGGAAPVMMERIESHVTLRNRAKKLTVYPLDGAGQRLAALPAKDVEHSGAAFRIHLQASGQAFAPWYEVVAEP